MTLQRHLQLGTGVSLLAVLLCILAVTPAAAGPNDTTDLAGMYGHVVTGVIAGATGPFTTVFHVSNATSAAINVNVKCFNDTFNRVGPALGSNLSISAFDVDLATPQSLGLTTDPLFTGTGWCYFAETSPGINDFSVAISMGIQGVPGNGSVTAATHPLFTSNASLAIGTATAQASVSNDDGNVPLWLGSNWTTFLIVANPVAAAFGTLAIDVYGSAGNLLTATATALQVGRDLETVVLSQFGGTVGNADLGRSTGSQRGWLGWVFAVNNTSLEAIFYDVPLDKDDATVLAPADRP